jgi:glutamine phosphoribosylpyrophosphate amidotransferase
MCSVIGVKLFNVSEEDLCLIKRVFVESRIRGKHATGLSYIKSGEIHTIKEPIPAEQFVEKYDFLNFVDNGDITLIGHCRYSTSDLEYNQPMTKKGLSIVHNGVITQELPKNWKSIYGYDCLTKNDSELILHSEDPLVEFNHMSMGVCELRENGTIRFYRNGKRPIYFTNLKNGYIITSTADIAKRVGLSNPKPLSMNTYMTIQGDGSSQSNSIDILESVDLQEIVYGLR